MHLFPLRTYGVLALIAFTSLSAGCASKGNPRDPLEPMNRSVYQFNEHFDRVFMKPAAIAYTTVTPPPIQGGVTNFFGNFRDVTTGVNNLLQAKVSAGFSDLGRVVINSTKTSDKPLACGACRMGRISCCRSWDRALRGTPAA
jgi:ABC-type transporter lipoprotein component MlaA